MQAEVSRLRSRVNVRLRRYCRGGPYSIVWRRLHRLARRRSNAPLHTSGAVFRVLCFAIAPGATAPGGSQGRPGEPVRP